MILVAQPLISPRAFQKKLAFWVPLSLLIPILQQEANINSQNEIYPVVSPSLFYIFLHDLCNIDT